MPESSEITVNITQAAILLQVTTKTIYNYLEKGLVEAQKWNGSWRIPKKTIIEFYEKKYGKKIECLNSEFDPTGVMMTPQEFAKLNECVGRLEVIQNERDSLKNETRKLHTRIWELEASAASGWTEARKCKEELENTHQTPRRRSPDALVKNPEG